MRPLQAVQLESGKVKLSGSFGVFFCRRPHRALLRRARVEPRNDSSRGGHAEPSLSIYRRKSHPTEKPRESRCIWWIRAGWIGALCKRFQLACKTVAEMISRAAKSFVFLFAATCCTAPSFGQQPAPAISAAPQVSAEDLAQPVGDNWTSYNGDYTGTPLQQSAEINAANVAQLRATWVFHPGNSQRSRSHSRGCPRADVRHFRERRVCSGCANRAACVASTHRPSALVFSTMPQHTRIAASPCGGNSSTWRPMMLICSASTLAREACVGRRVRRQDQALRGDQRPLVVKDRYRRHFGRRLRRARICRRLRRRHRNS